MRQERLSYKKAACQLEVLSDTRIASWEHIYLAEGRERLAVEQRGCGSKGRPKKLPTMAEKDFRMEVQRLLAEADHLKA